MGISCDISRFGEWIVLLANECFITINIIELEMCSSRPLVNFTDIQVNNKCKSVILSKKVASSPMKVACILSAHRYEHCLLRCRHSFTS
jgi:hypothetical protein